MVLEERTKEGKQVQNTQSLSSRGKKMVVGNFKNIDSLAS